MPSENTIKQYERIINTLVSRGGTDLTDTKKVLALVKTKINGEEASLPSQSSQLNAVIWKIGDAPQKEVYRKAMMENNKTIFENKTYTKTEKSVEWDELSKLYEKTDRVMDKAILALYSLAPPRRILDYTNMMVVDKEPSDTSKNYLVMGHKPYFVFNVYKTAGTYGKQKFEVPKELLDILTPIIKENDWLLRTTRGTQFTSPLFSLNMKNITERVSDGKIKATINTFRHAFISEILKYNPSTKRRKTISYMMGHNVSTQLEYDERDEE